MEPHKAAIEAMSNHELTLIPNKSMPGLIALLEGRAHMAMISASLKSEIDALQKVMPGLAYDRLQAHQVLNTRIAIGIHPSNRVRKASLNQIRKMLLGEITNWSALGRHGSADPRRPGRRRRRRHHGDRIRAAQRPTRAEDRMSSTSKRRCSSCRLSSRSPARSVLRSLPCQTAGPPGARHRAAHRADAESRHSRRSDASHECGDPGDPPGCREGHVKQVRWTPRRNVKSVLRKLAAG